jgi:hypothetical protein
MSNKNIRQLLAKLHDEIQKTEVDADTRSLMRELDSDVHDLLNSNTDTTDTDFLVERAKLLEAEFAISHPTAERFMREVIDALARMGI